MFDRYLRPIPIADYSGVGGRIKALVGLTALKMAKHRVSLGRAILDTFDTLWRPQALLTFIIVASSFGMGIGVNVTAPQFLAEPPRLFSPTIIASFCASSKSFRPTHGDRLDPDRRRPDR